MSNGVLYRAYQAIIYGTKYATPRCANLHISCPGRDTRCGLWPFPIKRVGHFPQQTRGAKTSITVKLKELPQGILSSSLEAPNEPDNGPVYPTVIQQARNNMQKYENCVLLTRVGGFYEVRWLLEGSNEHS